MANDDSTVDLLASSSNCVCPIDTGSKMHRNFYFHPTIANHLTAFESNHQSIVSNESPLGTRSKTISVSVSVGCMGRSAAMLLHDEQMNIYLLYRCILLRIAGRVSAIPRSNK